jgi:lipid-binding SYLF domain-containing protein
MATRILATIFATVCLSVLTTSCSTAPKAEDRKSFTIEASAAESWFETNVTGFKDQAKSSGGYIIFPDVGQFGIIFGGGTYGRGAVYNVSGEQVGWAALNRASIGLQLGAQSFKMAIIMQDKTTFESFKGGTWQGDVAATAVAARAGAATTAQFDKGVAVYIGDQAGLMAGMSIALSHVAYKNMSDVE